MEAKVLEVRGVDKKGQPFILRAGRSVREDDSKTIFRFFDVEGELRRLDGKVQSARADVAIYDKQRNVILFRGNVVIRTPGEWTLISEKLAADMRTRDVQSNAPVTVRLEDGAGEIHARGMSSRDGRKVIVFSGPVKARFYISEDENERSGENSAGQDGAGAGGAGQQNAGEDSAGEYDAKDE
jgi:LPS export ABC transporter protein LptC